MQKDSDRRQSQVVTLNLSNRKKEMLEYDFESALVPMTHREQNLFENLDQYFDTLGTSDVDSKYLLKKPDTSVYSIQVRK